GLPSAVSPRGGPRARKGLIESEEEALDLVDALVERGVAGRTLCLFRHGYGYEAHDRSTNTSPDDRRALQEPGGRPHEPDGVESTTVPVGAVMYPGSMLTASVVNGPAIVAGATTV